MGQSERHDERECDCVKYAPEMKIWEIRLDGINYLCRKCRRYIDPAKWHGGVLKFTNRSRLVKPNECPCCGRKLSTHRRAKAKLESSVRHQMEHPELHDPRALKTLEKKIYLIENDILVPRVK